MSSVWKDEGKQSIKIIQIQSDAAASMSVHHSIDSLIQYIYIYIYSPI